MPRCRSWIVVLLCVLAVSLAAAQEHPAGETAAATTSTTAPTSAYEGAAPTATATAPGADILAAMPAIRQKTLALDIAVSTWYELADLCYKYKLPAEGSAVDLRSRLYAFFGLKAPGKVEGASTVVVEQASSLGYFKMEESSQTLIDFSGGVRLTVTTPDGFVHRLYAGHIRYDREHNTVSAQDAVKYERTGLGRTDVFTGSSIAVNLSDYTGVFIDGGFDLAPGAGTSTRVTRLRAEKITRRSDDLVLFENAVATASVDPDPYYSIHASKVWLLGSGDWAVSNAVLYLGRVPVLWLPFFYYPSQEIVFHPVFGFRTREGAFLQTTTYLIGERAKGQTQTGLLSIVQRDGGGSEELSGIFLRRKSLPAPANPQGGASALAAGATNWLGAPQTGDMLKILADAYTSLGVNIGVEGKFKLGPAAGTAAGSVASSTAANNTAAAGAPGAFTSTGTLGFAVGLGFSRSIFLQASGVYSPFDAAGGNRSVWNSSNFLGMSLPFRYGIDFSLQHRWTWSTAYLDIQAALPFYSDPWYESDFRFRTDSASWLDMILGTQSIMTQPSMRSMFTQSLSLSGAWRASNNDPLWMPVLTLARLGSQFIWRSKPASTAGMTSNDLRLNTADPKQQFFFPDTVRLFDAALSLSGTIVKLESGGKAAAAREAALSAQQAAALAAGSGANMQPPAPSAADSKNVQPPAPSAGSGANVQPSAPSAADSKNVQPPAPSAADGANVQPTAPSAADSKNVQPTAPSAADSKNVQPTAPSAADGKNMQPSVPSAGQQSLPEALAPFIPAPGSPLVVAPLIKAWPGLGFTLGWTASGSAYSDGKFDSNRWNKPEDVDFSLYYLLFSWRGTMGLNARLYDPDGKGELNANLLYSLQDQARPLFNDERTSPASPHPYLLADYMYRLSTLSSQISAVYRPFTDIPLVSRSNVYWNFTTNWLKTAFAGMNGSGTSAEPNYETTGFGWNRDAIVTHNAGFVAAFAMPNFNPSLSFTANLPPLLDSYSLRLDLPSSYASFSAVGTLSRASAAAEILPSVLTARLSAGFAPWPVLNSDFAWNFITDQPQYWITSLSWQNLMASYSMRESVGYSFAAGYWTPDANSYFRPYEFSFSYKPIFGGKMVQEAARPGDLPASFVRPDSTAPVTVSGGISFTQNLLRFTESTIQVQLDLSLRISNEFSLSFSGISTNRSAWRYWTALLPSDAGIDFTQYQLNFFMDLWDSISIWDRAALERASFKLQKLSLTMEEQMHDWSVAATLAMVPTLYTPSSGRPYYRMEFNFSMVVKWTDIPDITSKVNYQKGSYQ